MGLDDAPLPPIEEVIADAEQKVQEEWDLEHKPIAEISDGLPSTGYLMEVLMHREDFRHTTSAHSRNAQGITVAVDVYQWVHAL